MEAARSLRLHSLPTMPHTVLNCAGLASGVLEALLAPWGLAVQWHGEDTPIPGSYWGDSEAGLIGNTLYVRGDTPVHSALHEAAHWICMDPKRRATLHTDAAGDYAEECGVCYLQILLADGIAGMGRARMLSDMDAWGYSFRLGSAGAWFAEDAEDARAWLVDAGIIDAAGQPLNTNLRDAV